MSPRELRLRRAALQDIERAREWYDQQQAEPDLGLRFVREVDAVLARIAEAPGHYAAVEGPIRRALVRRFPYGVFFIEDGRTIVVLAVQHQAMHLGRVRGRAPR